MSITMKNQATYNVAIIGKTGVGKSSIINYLYGENIVKTGVGDPVTKKGFHAIPTNINGLPTTIYDSMGLEADKYQDWMNSLETEIKARGADKPASDWFHSVFYCINAGGSRIEPVDSDVIQKLINAKYKVSVILTKCDQIDEHDEALFKNSIINKFYGISVIPTCVGVKTRRGETPAFGKVELQTKAFEDFFDSLISRLPIRCETVMRDVKNAWKRDVDIYVEDVNIGGVNSSEQHAKISKRTEKVKALLEYSAKQEFDNTLAMFADFAKKLGYPPISANSDNYVNIAFAARKETELSWIEVPFAVVLAPVAIVWGAIFGKSEAKDDLRKEIYLTSNKIDEYIELIKNEILAQLQSAKKNACK
jgi:energy-coupling factor transporter ATP-binding protein EcfA2